MTAKVHHYSRTDMKKKLLMLCLLVACMGNAMAQIGAADFSKMTTVIPPSPDAWAMTKFGGLPANRAAGTVSYNVPMVAISAGKIKSEVSVSYNSAGIKVDQIASHVGMSWSLQAGGVINRIINDDPDEGATRVSSPANLFTQNRSFLDFLTYGTLEGDGYDYQPDVFNFSFNGQSGKFVLDSAGNIKQIPKTNLRIEKNFSSSAWTFKITDQNGIQYYFGGDNATETTRTLTTMVDCSKHVDSPKPTAWYLIKMVSPNGPAARDSITFTYGSNEISYFSGASQTLTRTPYSTTQTGCSTENACGNIFTNQTCLTYLKTFGRYLTQITSSRGAKIVLSYDTGRTDVFGDVLLRKVELKTAANTLVKDFRLDYDEVHSSSTKISSVISSYVGSTVEYRNFLMAIKEYGSSGNELSRYTLRYYSPQLLPARLSFAQDHYGFYNGVNNTYLPAPSLDPNISSLFSGYTGNRESNPTLVHYGLLSSITYPTKGKDSLIYESNTYYTSKDSLPPLTSVPANIIGSGSRTAQTTFQTFTMTSAIDGSLSVSCALNPSSSFSYDPIHNFGKVTVTDLTTSTIIYDNNKVDIGENFSVTLTGTTSGHSYQLSITAIGEITEMSATVYFRSGAPVTVWYNKPAGGARIKKVLSYAADTAVALYKRYYYSSLAHPTQSSAVISAAPPLYYSSYITKMQCHSLDCDGPSCFYRVAHSNSQNSLYSIAGSHISYAAVTESIGGDAYEGGGDEYFYTTVQDVIASTFIGEDIPYAPMSDYSWRNALQTYHKQFKVISSTVVPVREEFNHYTEPIDSVEAPIKGYILKKNFSAFCVNEAPGEPFSGEFEPFDGAVYGFTSSWLYLDSVRTLQYDLDGHNPITTLKVNYYDNPSSKLLTRTQETKSNNDTWMKYYYAADYASISGLSGPQSTILAQLVTDGQIAAPAMVQEYVGPYNLIRELRIEYKTNATGNIVQSLVNVKDRSTSTYYKQTENVTYDDYDNLTSQQLLQLSPVSYLWGYNKEYPIAECKNAAANEFFFEGFEDGSGSDAAHTGSRYRTSSYTFTFTKPNARDYVYSYWLLQSGKWVYSGEMAYSGTPTISLGTATAIDDIRVYPADAELTTFTVSPQIGVTTVTDPKNDITYYEYDEFQRVMNIRDKDKNIVKSFDYHIKP